MNHVRQLVIAATISAVFAVTAEAQGPGRPTAGIFGGVTLVSGEFGDEVGNGWLAGGLVKMRAYGAFDVRLDGTYVKFGSKDIVGTVATVSTDASVVFGTLNALVNLGPDSAAYPGDNSVSPYLMAGLGLYELDYKAECAGTCAGFDDPEKKTHFGANVGFGATVPLLGIRTFAEARYHHISRGAIDGGSRRIILLSAGVKIR
jgi:hypothetical protein